jgi:hypothetical protein
MSAYVPPGWPSGVHPPGTEDFERTAQAWLLDTVPPDYRLHGVLRRYPLALAAMAIHHTKACVAGAREGYRTARTELGTALPPHALDAVLAAYRAEGRRLVATAQAVELVARALRGEVFTPQLQDAPPPRDRRGPPGPASEGQSETGDRPGSPGLQDELSTRREASGTESPAERPARDGTAKARKALAAQRPARSSGPARRKSRPGDKQAAAGKAEAGKQAAVG